MLVIILGRKIITDEPRHIFYITKGSPKPIQNHHLHPWSHDFASLPHPHWGEAMVFPMWEPPPPPLLGDFWSCDQRLWQGPSVGKGRTPRADRWMVFWWKKVALNGLTWFNDITKMSNMYHKWVVSLLKRMNIWKRLFLPTKMFVFRCF